MNNIINNQFVFADFVNKDIGAVKYSTVEVSFRELWKPAQTIFIRKISKRISKLVKFFSKFLRCFRVSFFCDEFRNFINCTFCLCPENNFYFFRIHASSFFIVKDFASSELNSVLASHSIRLMIRILYDTKQISLKRMIFINKIIEEISKQLAGWQKYCTK